MYAPRLVLRVTHMHVGSLGEGREDVECGEVAERPGGTVGNGRGGASLRIRRRLGGGVGADLDGPGTVSCAGLDVVDGPVADDGLGADASAIVVVF